MILGQRDKMAWLVGILLAIFSLFLSGVPAGLALFCGVVLITAGAFAGGCRTSDLEHAEREANFGLPQQ